MRESTAGGHTTESAMTSDVRNPNAAEMMRVEEEVVRDLRHSVGNHFHKLYYWADRLGNEEEARVRKELAESLNRALERFHEFLELGLKYFEADRASLCDMRVVEVGRASESLLRTEHPMVGVTLEIAPELDDCVARLDPQRFSFALRLVARLLGGERRDGFTCRLRPAPVATELEVELQAEGGEAPLETPVIEWALARKAVAMQGGVLRPSLGSDDRMGGCVFSLPLTR